MKLPKPNHVPERPFTYLAAPYSHLDYKVIEQRFRAINEVAGLLIEQGHFVFSPISMCHPIAVQYGLPGSWDYWQDYARKSLSVCHSIVVLQLDGWRESKGVQGELAIAKELKIPVYYYL